MYDKTLYLEMTLFATHPMGSKTTLKCKLFNVKEAPCLR